jgi:hypothetical protein
MFPAMLLLLCIPISGAMAADSSETDPASKNVASLEALRIAQPAPTVNGAVESYMFLSSRHQMRQLEPGRYEQQNLNVMPFYEIISLTADHLGHPGLSVHLQAIAGLDLNDVYFDNRFIADPVYGYIQFKTRYVDARLGRQMIFGGATQGLHIDGGRLTIVTPVHLGLDGYGGLLVSPKQGPDWYQNERATGFDDFGRGFTDWKREGDFAVGGRLFFKYEETANVGISLLQVSDNKKTSSRLLGADMSLAPTNWMALIGRANMDLTTMALRDAGGFLDFFIGSAVNFGVHYRHVDPSLYIANTSIFSVFSNEKHQAVGGSLAISPSSRFSIDMAYSHLFNQYLNPTDDGWTPEFVFGHQLDVDARIKFGALTHYGFVRGGFGRVARYDTAVNQIRLGTLIPFGQSGVKGALNAWLDFYQGADTDKPVGVLGDISCFYYTARIRTGATFSVAQTPYAETEMRGMLTFSYNFLKKFSNQE